MINPLFNNSFDSTIAWMNTPHVPSIIAMTSIHLFSWNIAVISQPHPVIMMTKMEMKTKDLTQEKIRMIGELFPNYVTKSIERVVRSIDFDASIHFHHPLHYGNGNYPAHAFYRSPMTR